LSNIPAFCTRGVLTVAIKNAIAKACEVAAVAAATSHSTATNESDEKDSGSPAPSRDIPTARVERVLIASPTVARQPPFSFTRVAWVTLTEGSSGTLVRGALRDLEVKVPLSSPGVTEGEGKAFTFRLRVTTHTPRSALNPLPSFMSDQSRIAFDVNRVTKLAALLDEDSGVAAESNLAAILETHTDLTPYDTLDIGIAYLRRVHFFIYYSGRKFESEAELLLRSSSIVARSAPPRPPAASDSGEGDTIKEDDAQNEVVDSHDEDEEKADVMEKKGGGDDDDDDDDDAGDSRRNIVDKGETIANGDHYHGTSNAAITAMDQRVSQFIDTLSKSLEVQRSREENGETTEKVYKNDDERDAEIIAAAQDEIMTEVTKLNCLEESEKVRCAVPGCSKLFKGKEFLKKHLQNKHPELALERMVRVAESFMRDRFESLPFKFRTLPPLEMEGYGGKIEEKAVKDIRDIALGIIAPSNPRKRRHNDDNFDGGRGGRGGYQGRPGEQANNAWGAARPPPPPFVPPQAHSMTDSNARTVSAYRDVDAPVAVSCVDSDFGVSLPPPKRKKVVIRKKK